jgi:uncharacterized Ntn-hydrolase superfamily protein
MTYSIVARDPETGELGVAVQSHAFSVGSIVTWAEAGVGAVATQSLTRMEYGPQGLSLMRIGLTAPQALGTLLQHDENREVRQVAMIDAAGHIGTHTGSKCIGAAGHIIGENFSVQANLMVDDSIWPAMQTAYQTAVGDLAERMLAALEAAQANGGDIRGQQSAAMLIVSGERHEQWWKGRICELRVEDHPQPVEELKRLYRFRKAYSLTDQVEHLLKEKQYDKAQALAKDAVGLIPDFVEMRFWLALEMLGAGDEASADRYFSEVFQQEPIWLDILPRLVPSGLLDEAVMKKLTNTYK